MAASSTATRVGLFRAAGVVVSGDDALVENTRSGVIRSDDAGIGRRRAERRRARRPAGRGNVVAAGEFRPDRRPDVAVLGGAGEETVVNHGRIVGDVVLGDGDDTFVFGNGGTARGDLLLGGGDDLVVIENGSGRRASRISRPATRAATSSTSRRSSRASANCRLTAISRAATWSSTSIATTRWFSRTCISAR